MLKLVLNYFLTCRCHPAALNIEMSNFQAIDITGQRFCRLTVLRQDGRHKAGDFMWLCRCDCEREVSIRGSNLRGGRTKSCGCLHPLGRWAKEHKYRTHGMSKTPEYIAYRDAMQRCRSPRKKDYARYGGRGIEFHFDSFEQFYAVLGPRPAGMSLDRINNNGHYEPSNVRWATLQQQRANQRPANRQHLRAAHKTAVPDSLSTASIGVGRWAGVRAELEALRAELVALTPSVRQKPTLEQLQAKLAALESNFGRTSLGDR